MILSLLQYFCVSSSSDRCHIWSALLLHFSSGKNLHEYVTGHRDVIYVKVTLHLTQKFTHFKFTISKNISINMQ